LKSDSPDFIGCKQIFMPQSAYLLSGDFSRILIAEGISCFFYASTVSWEMRPASTTVKLYGSIR
jgi:hypothetical protein